MSQAHHHHGGHHGHGHGHAHGATQRRLLAAAAVHVAYVAVEITYATWSGVLFLWADAAHMLSDAAALGLALFATWFAARPATSRHTFGFHRAEILAALVNSTVLLAGAVLIVREAISRLAGAAVEAGHGHDHGHGGVLTLVALGGLAANVITLLILQGGRGQNLNVRAAWTHVLVDTVSSVVAIAAGLLIWQFDWDAADPIGAILIAMLILVSTWSLIRESLLVLMEGAPAHVDVDAVRARLLQVPGVTSVHRLHVWCITSGVAALAAHVCAERPSSETIRDLRRDLHDRFGIEHATIEFDPGDADY